MSSDLLAWLLGAPVAHADIPWPSNSDLHSLAGTDSVEGVRTYLGGILSRFVAFSGFVAVLVIIYAGYLYMTDATSIAKAKWYLLYALAGFLVVLLASGFVTVLLDLPFFSSDTTAQVPTPLGGVAPPSGAPPSGAPPSSP